MEKKNKPKRGRKPADDPKEVVRIWVNRSTIKRLKGVEIVREVAYWAISEEEKKIINGI